MLNGTWCASTTSPDFLGGKKMTKIKCEKCGNLFDPTRQTSFCRGRGRAIRHYPTVPTDMPEFRATKVGPSKPQREPFQGDFRLFWNDDL